MGRELNEVVVVDVVRTPFGRAGEKGIFWNTRAEDLAVAVIKGLLERNPQVTADMIEDNIWGATTQMKEQGSTLGRIVSMLAGMGYEVINSLATSAVPIYILVILLFGKLFASSFVVAGRVSGGVLASSLFVGAMLGAIFGEVFYPYEVGAFMVLGMGAVLAATTNTPVATTIMMLEMSHSFDLVIPLALCVSIAYLASGGTSLYEGQKISSTSAGMGPFF